MSDEELHIRPASMLADHWWSRPGWRPGRLVDTWHVLFESTPEVRGLASACRDSLGGLPHLDLVPDEWLHMTVQGVGWSDESAADGLDAVIDSVTEEMRFLGPIEASFGPPTVKGEALVLPGHPLSAFRDLHARLCTAVGRVVGKSVPASPQRSDEFLPHVSVAYANAAVPATPYSTALRKVSPGTVSAVVRHVTLIRQDRRLAPYWRYEWTELARVPLGG